MLQKKKKTIGNNPLAAYLSPTKIAPAKVEHPIREKEKKSVASDSNGRKQRVTIHLSVDLINKVKDAVFWEPGLTLTDFAETALSAALEKLEKKRGKKYPRRKDSNLKGGRPLI